MRRPHPTRDFVFQDGAQNLQSGLPGQLFHLRLRLDSAAIGSIIRCWTSLKRSHGDLRLAGASGMLEGSLKMTKVDRVISLFPTVTAASENFVVAPPPGPSETIF